MNVLVSDEAANTTTSPANWPLGSGDAPLPQAASESNAEAQTPHQPKRTFHSSTNSLNETTIGVVTPSLSLNEWTVLALLGEGAAHGFALARELEPTSDLGRIFMVHRPLVYRALSRVVALGLAEPHLTEPGVAGPRRTQHRLTHTGRAAVAAWLATPVDHVRDLRIEFLLKLRLNERSHLDHSKLVHHQQAALADTINQLIEVGQDADVVDLWRRQNALATSAFLTSLNNGVQP